MILIEAVADERIFKKDRAVIIKSLKYIYSGKRYDKLDFDRYSEVVYKPIPPYRIPEKLQSLQKWIDGNQSIKLTAQQLLDDIDAGVKEELLYSQEHWDSEKDYTQSITDSQVLGLLSPCK
jgi:hypothetical protein